MTLKSKERGLPSCCWLIMVESNMKKQHREGEAEHFIMQSD